MTLVERLREYDLDSDAWLAADRIEQLEAENAALREDAERYHVLRSRSEWVVATRLDDVEYSDEWLDAAIDSARSQP